MSETPRDPAGRWGGSITSRPLPDGRDEIAELAPETRRLLATIWWSQAATEARVARSFEIVHRSLVTLGADAGLVRVAARAVDDEHRHRDLSRFVAEEYAGGLLEPTLTLPAQYPTHPSARTDEERAALTVVGQCALNETFASAYLGAARDACESPFARAALHELLKDEIDHARVGWAFLHTISPAMREVISDWLVPLVATNLREWRSIDVLEDSALEKHGVPSGPRVREALTEALSGVLIPGFQHVGLDTRALERFVRAGAPT